MGFFEKLRRKKQASEQSSAAPACLSAPAPNTAVMLFFDKPCVEIEELQTVISKAYGADAISQVDSSRPSVTHLMLRIDGIEAVCSYMPFPLPKEEGDLSALLSYNHFLSEEEQLAVVNHKSFCVIAEIGGGKTLAGKRGVCLMLTKLCGCLLQVDGAAGVYVPHAHLLLGKTMYLHYAEMTEQEAGEPDDFPSMLWVLVYQTRAEDGASTVETCGLEQFGFMELVFYEPKEEWAESFEKLYIMSTLQITEKEVYKNMDTISFTQGALSIFKQSGKKLTVIGGI